jgi:hypothetical protein
MKYAIALLLGVVVATQDVPNNQLVRINTSAFEDPKDAGSDDDDDSDEDSDDEGDDQLVQLEQPCVYLDETQDELDYQIDMFSRNFDARHWTNAQNIAKAIGADPAKMKIHTWELYDKAFSFPRVRRYNFVNDNMDMMEHFQDNANLNITNNRNMENWMRVAKQVQQNINTKFHNGEFNDPALCDPKDKDNKFC